MQNLERNTPLVDGNGRPTDYFMRLLQSRGVLQGDVETQVQQAIEALEALERREIATGTGLSGGGNLTADRELVLDAILANLNDVDFTTPPTDGQVMQYDAADAVWKPATPSGGGGGGGGGAPILCQLRQSTQRSDDRLAWAIVDHDPSGLFNSAVSDENIVFPSAGTFSASLSIQSSDTGGQLITYIRGGGGILVESGQDNETTASEFGSVSLIGRTPANGFLYGESLRRTSNFGFFSVLFWPD